ncbi:MAG: PAS domain S-box protein [Proteobacteria bacterium]|nr:PAS domain S-box protein [Pseudomonadota bacterium]
MNNKIRILYIDDYELDRELVKDVLEKEHGGFEVTEASDKHEFEALLKNREFDLVLSDFNIAGFEGLEVLETVQAHDSGIPVIIVTGTGSEEIAVKALKQGASDYVIKRPKHIRKLPQTIFAAIEKQTLEEQRRKAEFFLKESEKKYRSLFENMMNGYAYCRMIFEQSRPQDYIYLDVNRAFETLTGLKKALGKRVSEVIPGLREADPELFERLGRVALTGIPEAFEIYIRTLSKWFFISVYSPKKEHFVVIFDVIDERKQAEDALRESEDKFKHIFEHSVIGQSITFPSGEMQANKAFNMLLGYLQDELKNLRWQDITHPDDVEFSKKVVDLLLSGKKDSERLSKRYFHKNGSVIWADVSTTLRRDREGKPLYLMSTISDITKQKIVEEALHVEQERFSKAFRASPNPMTISRMADGTIIEVNEIWIETFGHSRAESVGKTSVSLGIWGDPANRKKAMQKLQETGSLRNYEIDLWRKSGEARHVLLSIECFEIESEQYLIAIVQDITERKKIEEELLKSRKLESIGILAGGIAHDFNNILTSIIGNIALARMQTKRDDERFELLSEAEAASAKAQALTKQLLTFARGGAPLKEIASIKEIVEESSLFVLRGSQSSCEFFMAEDLWVVEVDVGQISQVINNIVINANQAMPEGGIIRVAAENVIINETHGLPLNPGRYVRLSIKDQGVGIAEKYYSNIFDPYFTTKQEGSGLGLTTTYSIIKKHDGYITVQSRLGVGTTFNIYLPASEKSVPEKEEARLITGHGRILVMDDDESLRKTVGKILQKLGYEPEFAKDGTEAIEMYKKAKESKKPYDAVILDLTIPGQMGGQEAIKKLLEIDPEVKAIVSSGYSEDTVLSNFKEYGFKGIMPKPFEAQSLSKVLFEVLCGGNDKSQVINNK